MPFPLYASVDQVMRDRSELARKGIARGRSVVVLTFADGVVFVAENPSSALHKVSELYDRLGFAAVGKYNEFENLRRAGILHADMRGYSYDRRDVTGRALANAYAQLLGTIFSEQAKPYEVELCVAQVASVERPGPAQLYRIAYDGSITDESKFVVMGGTTEPITTALKESYQGGMDLGTAVRTAVTALQKAPTPGASTSANSAAGSSPEPRALGVAQLEVAVLDQNRPRRAFQRVTAARLEGLLAG